MTQARRARAPVDAASAALGLAPAAVWATTSPVEAIAGTVLLAGAAGLAYPARRLGWPVDAHRLYALARAKHVYQETGWLAQLKPGRPRPRIRVRQRPDGRQDLLVHEPPDAVGRTAEDQATFWARFVRDFEHRTARPWALDRQPGQPWVAFHPSVALPDPGHLQAPADTLRGGHPLLVPLGVYVTDQGLLGEALVDLRASNFAIGGNPGTGKTVTAWYLLGHLLTNHDTTPWRLRVVVLDVKRTWPRELTHHPAVLARETDDQAMFERLVAAQDLMMARYAEADRPGGPLLADLIGRDGYHLVAIEELSELLARFRARVKPDGRATIMWSRETRDGFVGADQVVEVIGSLARMGREAGVLLCPAVAQDWNAAQFGEAGGSVRRLFAARTSGWQEPDGARMLGLPEAASAELLRAGAPIAGRFAYRPTAGQALTLQMYPRTREELIAIATGTAA
jgi:hypothetical protein